MTVSWLPVGLQGSSSVPTSPAAGQPSSSRLVNRGLQYLRQHSQQAGGAPRDVPTTSLTSADPDQQLASEPQQPGAGIKAKGSRMAKTMLSRMNQAGKALAQHYQQAQQARHQQQGGAGAGAGGAGPSRAAAPQATDRGRLHSD